MGELKGKREAGEERRESLSERGKMRKTKTRGKERDRERVCV